MNFAMADDVLSIVDSIADFFARRGDALAVADAAATSAAFDRRRWTALCEMGLPVLRLPEPDGVGAGLLEATAVAEKIGAALVPEPAVAGIVLAEAWNSIPAAAGLLDDLRTGSVITALGGFDTVELASSGEISGQVHVPDDGVTDRIALLARDPYSAESAMAIFDLGQLPLPGERVSVDPTRPTALVNLEGVEPVELLRVSSSSADRIRRHLAVLTAAELVGGMQKVLTDTVEHVKTRHQFGRALGSFQAVKHKLADMYAASEQARAAVQFAALACTDELPTESAAVSSVARWVPRKAIGVFEDAIHLRGAMGYSWEVDVHLHLRRSLVSRAALNRSEVSSCQSVPARAGAV